MKKTVATAAILAALSLGSASAATILTLTNIGATGQNLDGGTVSATEGSGTFSAGSSSATLSTGSGESTAATTTYAITVTNLTIDGMSGYTLNFDLVLAATSPSTLTPGIVANSNSTWTVDGDGAATIAPAGSANENTRINQGESLSFTIANAVLSGNGGGTATHTAFAMGDLSPVNNVNTFTIAANGSTITATAGPAASDAGRVTGLDVSFTLTAIPEPSSTALLGLAGLTLILRRRR